MDRSLPVPLTILVIDDEPSITRGLAQLLRRDGVTVDTASNGQEALARLQAREYDVILCDLHMPALNGATFYACLTQQWPALCSRVVFLTGDTLRADSIAFLEMSGQPWLAKPCTIAAIRRTIAQVLRMASPAPNTAFRL